MSDNDLNVYIFQGNNGEKVPENVEKLIIDQSIRIVPRNLCLQYRQLREVTLPKLLERILDYSFSGCRRLLKIRIGSMVRFIGKRAFANCRGLKELEFEDDDETSSSQQLTIEEGAFRHCPCLSRIKLPASVTAVGEAVFTTCNLIEANLSKTRVTEISDNTFAGCALLLSVSLPNTLERIGGGAFLVCPALVTVVVPLDSKPITVGIGCFHRCQCLTNLVLPEDSFINETSFNYCGALHDRFGTERGNILDGLIARFDDHPVHGMCYDHSTITAQQLRQCIIEEQEKVLSVDEFGMTPFHVLFSTVDPRLELLDILLDQYPCEKVLNYKDAHGKRALDYLINNWTGDTTAELLRRALQKWMVDSLVNWGAMLWVEEMKTKLGALLLSELDNEQRETLFNEAYSAFGHYEKIEYTSILEIALWKGTLKSGRNNDGSKRQVLDRGECRCLCGSDIVIPNVIPFLWA